MLAFLTKETIVNAIFEELLMKKRRDTVDRMRGIPQKNNDNNTNDNNNNDNTNLTIRINNPSGFNEGQKRNRRNFARNNQDDNMSNSGSSLKIFASSNNSNRNKPFPKRFRSNTSNQQQTGILKIQTQTQFAGPRRSVFAGSIPDNQFNNQQRDTSGGKQTLSQRFKEAARPASQQPQQRNSQVTRTVLFQ